MTTRFIEKRPTSISIIGWLWIILGTWMLFSGMVGFLAFQFQSKAEGYQRVLQGPGMAAMMFRHFTAIASVQACVAIVGIVAGIQFLRLRAWARTVIEIMSWLGLIFVMGLGITILTILWTQRNPNDTVGIAIGLAIGANIFVVFGAVLLWMIRYLRSPEVRSAVSSPHRSDGIGAP